MKWEVNMKNEDTTRVVREYYVIKIKKGDKEVYWTDSKKQIGNITSEFSRAKKYKVYEEAKAKALQICEVNSMVTWVIRYIESVRETYTDVCLPFRSPRNSNSLTIRKDELD